MRRSIIIAALIIALSNPLSSAVSADVVEVGFIITNVTPKVFEPGYRGSLNITIKNVGVKEGHRINAEFQKDPLVPVNFIGETKKYLDLRDAECTDPILCNFLGSGDTANFIYEIFVEDDAATGGYSLPLNIIWKFAGLEKTSTLNFGFEIEGEPDITVSGTSTNPSIIYPDTEFSMPITVENKGTDSAKSVELSVILASGFSGSNTAFIGTLDKDNVATATLNLKAEKEIDLGSHDLLALIEYIDSKGNTYNKSVSIPVFIQDRGEVKLSFSGINTSPSKVYPNTEFALTLSLENTGSQAAKAIKMDLNLPDEFTGEDTSFLGTIEKDDSSSATLDMKAIKRSQSGKYPITARLTYTDEQGNTKTDSESFNLFILERGEVILEISGKSTSPTKLLPGTDFTLSLQLENIGDQDAKSVKIDLEANGDLKGEFTSFVGEIEKDDVSTGVFDLSVSPTAEPGRRMINAKISFLDERGIESSVQRPFDLFIGEAAGRSSTTTVAVVVIVLLIILYLWRRRKSEYTEA
jgi:hypothetical protein